MKRLPRCLTVVLAALVLSLPLSVDVLPARALGVDGVDPPLPEATAQQVGMSSERLARIGEALDAYAAEGRLAGSVVLVARSGRLVYWKASGQGDLAAPRPMARDDIFRIASQTKAIVSVAVMMLQEEGRLLISDPLRKHLPAFETTRVAVAAEDGSHEVVEAEEPITLRHLLTHTSGYGYGGGVAASEWSAAGIQGWYFADRDQPIGTVIDRMAALPTEAQPGERFVYGYSTDILGAVVERVSGQDLATFLRTRLFEPLDMRDTHFFLPGEKRDRLATVYSAVEDAALERAPDPGHMVGQGAYVTGPRRSFSGGAGLLSTAGDYARFLQMLANGGELEGARLLSPPTVALMIADHVGDVFPQPGVGFGLGFAVVTDLGARGRPGSVGEFGWGGAYHSTYWVDPQEELVVVYLTQLIPAGDLDDHGRVRALVYASIVDSYAD